MWLTSPTPSSPVMFIDPGVRGSGISVWTISGRLEYAMYVKGSKTARGGYECVPEQISSWASLVRPCLTVIELPRIYPPKRFKNPKTGGLQIAPGKDPNDLVHVAAAGGGWAVFAALRGSRVLQVMPSEWKGNTKKELFTKLIKRTLDQAELTRCFFTNKSDDIDMLDAIGMGKWFFGKLGQRTPAALAALAQLQKEASI